MSEYIDPNAFKEITENPIILDFTECKGFYELHSLLKEKFGLPEYYGKNWDALWDCLDGLFEDDGSVEVHLYGVNALKKRFGKEVDIMLDVFKDVHTKTPNVVFKIMS